MVENRRLHQIVQLLGLPHPSSHHLVDQTKPDSNEEESNSKVGIENTDKDNLVRIVTNNEVNIIMNENNSSVMH